MSPDVAEGPKLTERFLVELLFRLLNVFGKADDVALTLEFELLQEVGSLERSRAIVRHCFSAIRAAVQKLGFGCRCVMNQGGAVANDRPQGARSGVGPGHTAGLGEDERTCRFIVEYGRKQSAPLKTDPLPEAKPESVRQRGGEIDEAHDRVE